MGSSDSFHVDRSPLVGSTGREYVVLSRAEAEDPGQSAFDVPHVLISIGDAGSPDANVPDRSTRQALLRLKFDDLTATYTPNAPFAFKPELARQVAELVRSSDASLRIVAQCQFGISRSAAIVMAIAEALGDLEVAGECTRRFQPNRWVYQISAEVFRKELQTHP